MENMFRTGCYFGVPLAALAWVDARTSVKIPFLANAFAPLLLFTFLAIYMLSRLYLLLRLCGLEVGSCRDIPTDQLWMHFWPYWL